MIRNNPDAAKAVAAIGKRGSTKKWAHEEVARVLVACLFEVSHGMPDRLAACLVALSEGKTAESLFPDELYSGGEDKGH